MYRKYFKEAGNPDGDGFLNDSLEVVSDEKLLKRAKEKRNMRLPVNTGIEVPEEEIARLDLVEDDHYDDRRMQTRLDEYRLKEEAIMFESTDINDQIKADMLKLADSAAINQLAVFVKLWEIQQKNRIAVANQIRSLSGKMPERRPQWHPDLPCALLMYFFMKSQNAELQLEAIIERIVRRSPMWEWLQHICGIGEKLAAQIITTFVVREHDEWGWVENKETHEKEYKIVHLACGQTSGSWERFAGMDPTTPKNGKGEKRVYSADAKKLMFKFADICAKGASRFGGEGSLYAKAYRDYYAQEVEKNEAGLNRAYCEARLANVKGRPAPNTEAYKCYVQGKLPQAQVILRAYRKVSKLFLNHYHTVYYGLILKKKAPIPYVIEHLGHAHQIFVPCWDAENLKVVPPKFSKKDEPDWFVLPWAAEMNELSLKFRRKKATLKKEGLWTPEVKKAFDKEYRLARKAVMDKYKDAEAH